MNGVEVKMRRRKMTLHGLFRGTVMAVIFRDGATAKNVVQDSRRSVEIRTMNLCFEHNSRKLPLQAY
jgi:hypothetical protein